MWHTSYATAQRFRKAVVYFVVLVILLSFIHFLFLDEIFDGALDPVKWQFKDATIKDAIYRQWGPGAALQKDADGKCARFVRPVGELMYGAISGPRYKKYPLRRDRSKTMAEFFWTSSVPPPPYQQPDVVSLQPPAPRSIICTLTINSQVASLLSMLESLIRFVPSAKQYPYYFFNDEPFREDVKEALRGMLCTFKSVHFEVIPKEHWLVPEFIDKKRLDSKLEYYRTDRKYAKIPHMASLTYRLMCRWNSGPFALHPALKDVDYFWRIDDDLRFLCPVLDDPLLTMARKNIVYGYGMTMQEIMLTVPSLMSTVVEFANTVGSRGWLSPTFLAKDGSYTRCHFWNNLALGDLRFFRSARYQEYFDYLDRSGGFFYERWGDAPIQTLGVALLSAPNRSYHFHDISYGHDQFFHLASKDCAPGISFYSPRSDRFGESRFSCLRDILPITNQSIPGFW